MRITLARADLTRVLSSVAKVVEARTTIPILSNVLLSVDGGRLTVRGTDLDIEASASVQAIDAIDGATTVEAKLLADIAKKAAGDVTLELEGNVLHVKSGRSRFRLPTLPASDFPSLDAGTFDATFDVDLAALVAPVAFAVSTEETRYYLNGVFLHNPGSELVAVATDGHRLSRNTTATVGAIPAVILPRKLVSILPKGTVTVSLSKTKVRIATGDTTLTSKLIDGTFPDYQRIIPQNNDKIVTVDKATLAGAVQRVSVVSSERGRAVKLSVVPGSIELSVRGDAEATDAVEADYSGEPIEIGFNAAYLGDILANLTGSAVRIALADSGSPTLFSDPENDAALAICMPMRV